MPGEVDRSYALKLASFAAELIHHSADAHVRHVASTRLADTVACMRGAFTSDAVRQAKKMAARYSTVAANVPGSSIPGSTERVSIEAAAFVNGIAARYLDFNDIYLSKEAVHPSDNIPSAMALAEALESTGEALLTALIVGYEIHCRLADTVSTRKGKWDNVILGAIAASVMAGSLLKLDTEQQADAICMATVGNIALMETRVGSLSMWKAAAAAYASRAGVFAALAASEGLKGPGLALEGTHGLFAQVTGYPEKDIFTTPIQGFHLLDTHMKAYPAQYFTQTAISAALSVRGQIDIAQVEKITVNTFEFGRIAAADSAEKWNPTTRETADHSMPYCVAVALRDGELNEASFEPACIAREDVRALMRKIGVKEDPSLTAQYPEKVATRIQVELRGGRSAQALVEYPLGHSRNPMSTEDLTAKFVGLSGNTDASRSLLSDLMNIEDHDGPSTSALLRRITQV